MLTLLRPGNPLFSWLLAYGLAWFPGLQPTLSGQAPAAKLVWQKVAEGLVLGEYSAPLKSTHGDSKITILKVDPRFFRFKLIESGAHPGVARTAAG